MNHWLRSETQRAKVRVGAESPLPTSWQLRAMGSAVNSPGYLGAHKMVILLLNAQDSLS